MGRRGRQKQRQRADDTLADADKAEEAAIDRIVRSIPFLKSLLLETPSGFAVFSMNTSLMDEENAIEHIWSNFIKDYMAADFIWLREFQEFEDKFAAINRTAGVGKQLKDMLKVCCRRVNKLLVGSLEYKEIIEADQELGITCFYDELVEEVMWGVKNLMRSLVPQEQKVLTKEERLPMSKGLDMILRRHNFDVKPEMVNDDIVETACFFYDCDLVMKKHSRSLHMSDSDLMEISGFNSQNWDTMKIATALKKIAYPEEKIEHPPEMFSKDELSKIEKDASKYNNKTIKQNVSKVFEELVRAKRCKETKLALMQDLVQKATKMAGEAAKEGSIDLLTECQKMQVDACGIHAGLCSESYQGGCVSCRQRGSIKL